MTAEDFLQKYRNEGAESLTAKDLEEVLGLEDFSPIFALADRVRYENFGDIVDIRAILEFSNHCRRACRYCGLNRENHSVVRYRMEIDEIVEVTLSAYRAGYRTIVLQSGEDPFYTVEMLCEIVRRIKAGSELFITLSCGERKLEDYQKLFECGADRYLLKHETADREIYQELHPCGTLEGRVECLREIKRSGYEAGSGFMIGLPNQSLETIAKDVLLLRELHCDMAGIGPFIPSPNTPLSEHPAGSTELTKRAVALARLLLPKANLPATTSLGVLDSKEKDSVFSCGANVIMRKVTPQKYEQHYSIYPNEIKVDDVRKERKKLEDFILGLGRIPR
ncbi:MAG: [FeFe] hydrogenase H-cluster radical SAM maturase HydE [Peptostreptococcaceae bacterium]|nr:[FeFe] hydrogenase H-cluster radical SAM maturase HydE [Peptostreptococcaceae bacterium]